MSSVRLRMVAEGERGSVMVVSAEGGIGNEVETDMNTIFNGGMSMEEERIFILCSLKLAAVGKDRKSFLQLLQRKNGIVINY